MTRELRVATLVLGLLVVGLAAPLQAERSADDAFDGTWTVVWSSSMPGAPPPFPGLMALHADGILAETSSGLHPNSVAAGGLPFNASDGYGTWVQRSNRRTSAFTFYKMLFAEDGSQAGYLRIRGSLEIDPGNRNHMVGDNTADLIFGPDPTGPVGVSFGGGGRLEATRLRVLTARP
jgi:hypothetical protein